MTKRREGVLTSSFLQMISCEGIVVAIGLSFLCKFFINIVNTFENQLTWGDFKNVYPDRLIQYLFACAVCAIFMIFLVGLTSSKALRFNDPKIRKRIRLIFISLFAFPLLDVLILLLCDTCFVRFVL